MKYKNKVSAATIARTAAGSGKPDFERVRQVSASHREQHGGTVGDYWYHHSHRAYQLVV